ncbi:MAG: hypothetical protein WC614_10470 [bacterium]
MKLIIINTNNELNFHKKLYKTNQELLIKDFGSDIVYEVDCNN